MMIITKSAAGTCFSFGLEWEMGEATENFIAVVALSILIVIYSYLLISSTHTPSIPFQHRYFAIPRSASRFIISHDVLVIPHKLFKPFSLSSPRISIPLEKNIITLG
jgi:hypothetical protein